MKPRYLPPGALTWLRVRWLLLGVAIGVAGAAGLAMYLAAIMPPELAYRSPATTVRPVPGPVSALPAAVALPPCTGQGKDCTDSEATPHLQPVRTVPEPTALALVGIGLAVLVAHHTSRSPT